MLSWDLSCSVSVWVPADLVMLLLEMCERDRQDPDLKERVQMMDDIFRDGLTWKCGEFQSPLEEQSW